MRRIKLLSLLVLLMTATGAWAVDYYYVIGSMNGWEVNANYKMAPNTGASTKEYMFVLDLKANDELKIVSSANGTDVKLWYPSGMDNNYKVNADGKYVVYFRPNGDGGSDWHENFIYLAGPITYSVKMKDATHAEAGNWTIASGSNSVKGNVAEGLTGLKGDGSETVTLTYTGRLKVKGVKVKGTPVESITLNKEVANVVVGQTVELSANVLPIKALDKTVTWSSSDDAIASVTPKGVVTAKAQGNASIYATANDGTGVKATCSVNCLAEATQINMAEQTADVTIPDYTKVEVAGGNGARTVTVGKNSEVTFDDIDVSAATLQGDATITIKNKNN